MSSGETPPTASQPATPSTEPTAPTPGPTTDSFGVKPPTPTMTGADRFDYLAQVVRPNLLIALIAIVLVIAGATLWATLASITSSTSVTMAVVPFQGFANVASPDAGTITKLDVQLGDKVAAGKLIGVVTTGDGKRVEVRSLAAGTVVDITRDLGSVVKALDSIVAIAPTGEPRTIMGYPGEGSIQDVSPGQSAVVSAYGCPTLATTVASVGQFPETEDGVYALVGVRGLAMEMMSAKVGILVRLDTPQTWCPQVAYGALVDVVITTGSTHPISYVTP